MAADSTNVDVAVTGAVSYAPVATTPPTDAETPLAVAFLDTGYISDDGVSEAIDTSTSNLVAWQGSAVVRTVVTESSISVTFTMIETNENSVGLFYAAQVDGSDGSVEIDPSKLGGRRRLVLDYVDGDKFVRLFLPQAEVTERGEVTYASGEAVGYQVTVTGYPDASLGYSAKKWFSALVTTP
jgi:hypothetical protein